MGFCWKFLKMNDSSSIFEVEDIVPALLEGNNPRIVEVDAVIYICFMHQLSHDLDIDEINNYKHQVGSPSTSSPPGAWVHISSPVDNSSLRAISISPTFSAGSPVAIGHSSESTSVLHPLALNSSKIAPIGKEQFKNNPAESFLSGKNPIHGIDFLQSHSFPEQGGMMQNLGVSSSTVTSFDLPTSSTSRMGTLTGPQFLWGSPNSRLEYNQSSALSMSSSGNSFSSDRQRHVFTPSYLSSHGSLLAATRQHVGSAPPGIPFEKLPGFVYDLPGSSFVNSASLGNLGICRTEGEVMVNSGILRGPINPGSSFSGIMSVNASPGPRMMSSPRMGHMFVGNPPSPSSGHGSNGMECFTDHAGIHQTDNSGSLLDSKKPLQLDLDKIISGEDTRTTLMIKNIPIKYTSKMLLSAIDENYRGTYDFLYLPIDFKNKCNVGCAFINMVSPSHIISFYQAFNGRRWEKFNSEKVALLAYARIQGKEALVSHFQNSSLMNEDKRCPPLLFDFKTVEASDQEPFLANGISTFTQQKGNFMGDLTESLLISKIQEEKPSNGSVPGSEFAE